jgi:branched-chain amino acid transport system substrate-binding protein
MNVKSIGILAITAVVLLTSCFGTKDIPRERSHAAAQEGRNIKIGLVWPFELYKDLVGEGVELAVEQINEAGGILGKKIELVVRDDEADINEGLRIAESFAEDPDIMAVIGHCNSYVSLAVALTYETGQLIMFSPASTNPELTQKGYQYVFRNVPTDDMIGRKAAELCAEKGYKSIIICYSGNAYGLGLANAFERRARGLELKIVDRSSFNLGDAAEFEYILDKWEIFNYDAIFFAGLIDAGTTFITKAREREKAGGLAQEPLIHPIVGGDGIDSIELLKLPEELSREVLIVTMYNPYSWRPEAVSFNQSYIKKYSHDPDSWGALGYDALNIIVEAMRRAGSVDPKKVAPEIKKIEDWKGVTGTHTFDDRGDVAQKTLVLKFISDGEFKYLELE